MSTSSIEPAAGILGEAIPEIKEPVLFKNLLIDSDGKNIWKLLDWEFNDLADKLGGLKLPFRIGVNGKTSVNEWIKSLSLMVLLKSIFQSINRNRNGTSNAKRKA